MSDATFTKPSVDNLPDSIFAFYYPSTLVSCLGNRFIISNSHNRFDATAEEIKATFITIVTSLHLKSLWCLEPGYLEICKQWGIIGFVVPSIPQISLFLMMVMKIRVAGDDLGAVVNMLVYTPCFMLISKAIYNVEATQLFSRRMTVVCSAIYLIILAVFGIGYWRAGSFHIGLWLYVMLFFYVIGNVYCVGVILREMLRRRRMLETMAASDIMPYVRYSRASVFIVCVSALAIPAAILSTTLLYVIGPLGLLAFLFFIVNFISLGNSYVPTDELLDSEEEKDAEPEAVAVTVEQTPTVAMEQTVAGETIADDRHAMLSAERCTLIQQRLDDWCANMGYKDSAANLLTLSRSVGISKRDLTQYFDQCQHSTFRVWLSGIRFQVAKDMMREYPDYSNDAISAECGFSARTQLYRIFKAKEGCTPTAWRDGLSKRQ